MIVNESLVRHVMGDRHPIGRRLRHAGSAAQPPGPWHEIVGVVRDLGMVHDNPRHGAGLYRPAAPGVMAPVPMAVRVSGSPQSSGPRVRVLAAAVDPALRLHDLVPLADVGQSMWLELDFLFRLLVLVSAQHLQPSAFHLPPSAFLQAVSTASGSTFSMVNPVNP